jgi:cell division septation protein DedD
VIERDAQPPTCPGCGETYEPDQQHCLECGSPLPRPTAGTGRPPLWVWALGALAIVITGAVIGLVAASDDEAQSTTVASPANTAPTTPPESPPIVETTAVTEEVVPPSVAPESPADGTLLEWPAGTSGYTVILASIPSARSRGDADARAESALAAGLSDVGVLDSASYSNLRPGYWVVFTGVYSSLEEARSALGSARSAGFPDAYTRRVE